MSSADPLLIADGVSKRYRMGRVQLEVLSNCSLQVSAGAFVSIMGRSGSGKSTLLHILGALDAPQQGQVRFRGQPVFPPEGRRWFNTSALDALFPGERRRIRLRRRAFGFVFQFYHLLPELNVLENVLLPHLINYGALRWTSQRRAARDAALALIERVGLLERIRHLPRELSGGERQRVAIARALVHNPPVLLADEPTGNLDAEAGRSIMDLLLTLHAEGQTTVMVTHDPALAREAQQQLVLEGGRLKS